MALTKAQRTRIERYDSDNRRSAFIILADIRKYGGEGSAAVQWARAIRSKPESTGELFEENETAGSVSLSAV